MTARRLDRAVLVEGTDIGSLYYALTLACRATAARPEGTPAAFIRLRDLLGSTYRGPEDVPTRRPPRGSEMSTTEVAARLGITPRHVRRLTHLHPARTRRGLRYHPDDVAEEQARREAHDD